MMTTLSREIIEYIAAYSETDSRTLSGDTEIGALGLRSQEMADILFHLEDRYGVETRAAGVWSSFARIGDVVHVVGAAMLPGRH